MIKDLSCSGALQTEEQTFVIAELPSCLKIYIVKLKKSNTTQKSLTGPVSQSVGLVQSSSLKIQMYDDFYNFYTFCSSQNPINSNLTRLIFTDQWSNVTNMPTVRYGQSVAAVDNKIYVTGGEDNDDQTISSVDCYDLDTNTWSQMANMNIARRGHSLISVHGRLYAIGGFGVRNEGSSYVDIVDMYDPNSNTWTMSQHKLDGGVSNGACLVKKYFLIH